MIALLRIPLLLLSILLLASTAMMAQGIPGGPSLRDQANRMLGSGDLDSARLLLEEWLAADPGDENSWYNLACVRALAGDREGALDAWEGAVAAGWEDPDHPLSDSDLASIREDARFTAALATVSERQDAAGPSDYQRHHLALTTTGTYIVLLPPNYEDEPNRSWPLCIILHGSGSTELAHGRLADAVGRDDYIFVAPRAPQIHSSVHKATGNLGYSAWTPEKIDSLDPAYRQVAPQYAAWAIAAADDVRDHYRVAGNRYRLLGHSQGAAFTWITAALYPERVASIFAYAGYFPEEYRTDEHLDGVARAGVDITLAHGNTDRVVAADESKTLDSILTARSIEHSLRLFDETGHGTTPAVIAAMKDWLEDQLR